MSTTSVMEPSMFRSFLSTTAFLRFWPPPVTLILEVRVIVHFVKQYKKKTGTVVSPNLCTMGKLKREVEKAKRTLSNQQSTRLEIESFGNGNDLSETLTRAKFEELDLEAC